MAEYGSPTWKVQMWVQNDEFLYTRARECGNEDEMEAEFLSMFDELEHHQPFAHNLLLDLLGPVDWAEVLEAVKD